MLRGAPVVLSSLLAILVVIWSLTPSYCERLVKTARNRGVQDELQAWVHRHLAGHRIAYDQVQPGDGIVPGFHWLGMEFDGELLGFERPVHVHLVGPRSSDALNDTITESVRSVLFTEGSRTGILVRAPDSTVFGVPAKHLIPISEDIVVVCMEQD
jgi:hypothetical protein